MWRELLYLHYMYDSTPLSAVWFYIMYTIKGITISRNNTTRYKMRLGIMKRKEKVNSHSASCIVSISHCYMGIFWMRVAKGHRKKENLYVYKKRTQKKQICISITAPKFMNIWLGQISCVFTYLVIRDIYLYTNVLFVCSWR